MPAYRYQAFWKRMPFFAMPSFYDGRVRINLAGREANGRVQPTDYDSTCDTIENLVRSCRDVSNGEPVVGEIERCGGSDPRALGPSACDMVVVWRGAALGFEHPKLGRVGPVPYRRTGGHTGPYGMAYLAGPGVKDTDLGVRSSFDVAPTIAELLDERMAPGSSGSSFLSLALTGSPITPDAR
jgi:predicted AlkP superfamily phosphohydrolase/phosphomutase